MQLNSFLKFGSLAFDVANDEKLRQLLGMVHHGARRRGFFQPPPMPPQPPAHIPAHWPHMTQPIPFSPAQQAQAKTASPAVAEKPKTAAATGAPGIDLKQWVNMDSAKKALGFVSTINQFLNNKSQ